MSRKLFTLSTISLFVLGLGCGGYTTELESGITQQQDRISECGGFEKAGDHLFGGPENYCDAEVLHWQYVPESQTLHLADARVLLNCCGDHTMTIKEVEGVYVVTETDDPEDGWGRCHCMCVFDYTMSAVGLAEGVIQLKIVREVSDWPEGSGDVWEGELDLSEGSGAIVIDDETDVTGWCGDI